MTFTKIAFSHRTLPEGNPVEVMKDFVGRTLIRLEITLPNEETPLDYQVGLHQSPAAQWGYWSSLPVLFERTNTLLQDGNDDVMLALLDEPIVMSAPGLEDLVVDKGDVLLFSQARAFSYRLPRTTRGWTIRMPRKELAALLPDLDEAPIRRIPRHIPGLALLRAYLRATTFEHIEGQTARYLAGRHLQELAALVIKDAELPAPEAVKASVSAARRAVVEADMRENLDLAGFDLAALAKRHGVGSRQLQRLFALDGTTFSDLLRQMRLERAAVMLTDEALATRSILSIALDIGFVDVPTFNRAFKRHFGIPPGEMRVRAAVNGQGKAGLRHT